MSAPDWSQAQRDTEVMRAFLTSLSADDASLGLQGLVRSSAYRYS